MTKTELVERVAAKYKLPVGRAALIVEHVFATMSDAFLRDEGIEIRGFGSFVVRRYPGYAGRNPRSGEAVTVKPKRIPFFKVGKELRERVKAGGARQKSVPVTKT